MTEEADDDKQHEATEKKLEDARNKGEFPKSVDLNTAAAYSGFLIAAVTIGPFMIGAVGNLFVAIIDQADEIAKVTFSGSQSPFIGGTILSFVTYFLPIFILPAVFAILSILAQRSFKMTPENLKPKISRISILQGFKNKFGRNGIFEFFKSAAKLIAISSILLYFLFSQIDRLIFSIYSAPAIVATEMFDLTQLLIFVVILIALPIGAVDFLWQRAEHFRKNRMSRKEILDEMKQSDGDPMMKQMRRQKAVDLATNRMLVDVPSSDVVIVNPTHFAVALRWDRLPGTAPSCVAKGTDEIAARIRELAIEHGVPIHSDPPTARALHATVRVGDEIPPDHYRTVAAAIRFAERMRHEMGGTP